MAKEFLENWNGVPVYLDLIPYGTRRTGQKLDTEVQSSQYIMILVIQEVQRQQNVNHYKNTYMEPWASALLCR